jgi:hypothetical protein
VTRSAFRFADTFRRGQQDKRILAWLLDLTVLPACVFLLVLEKLLQGFAKVRFSDAVHRWQVAGIRETGECAGQDSGVSSGVSWFCHLARCGARCCVSEDVRIARKYTGFAAFCISLHDGAGCPRAHYESDALASAVRQRLCPILCPLSVKYSSKR